MKRPEGLDLEEIRERRLMHPIEVDRFCLYIFALEAEAKAMKEWIGLLEELLEPAEVWLSVRDFADADPIDADECWTSILRMMDALAAINKYKQKKKQTLAACEHELEMPGQAPAVQIGNKP